MNPKNIIGIRGPSQFVFRYITSLILTNSFLNLSIGNEYDAYLDW